MSFDFARMDVLRAADYLRAAAVEYKLGNKDVGNCEFCNLRSKCETLDHKPFTTAIFFRVWERAERPMGDNEFGEKTFYRNYSLVQKAQILEEYADELDPRSLVQRLIDNHKQTPGTWPYSRIEFEKAHRVYFRVVTSIPESQREAIFNRVWEGVGVALSASRGYLTPTSEGARTIFNLAWNGAAATLESVKSKIRSIVFCERT